MDFESSFGGNAPQEKSHSTEEIEAARRSVEQQEEQLQGHIKRVEEIQDRPANNFFSEKQKQDAIDNFQVLVNGERTRLEETKRILAEWESR